MTDDNRPWEPPLSGTETEHLLGALDRQRWTFRWKAGGLDAAGLQTRIGASTLTIGGLLKHLAFVEDYTFTTKMRGEPPSEPWRSTFRFDIDDWVFVSAADDSPDELYALWDEAVATARVRVAAAIAVGGLDQPVDIADDAGQHASLRRLVFDLVEEYGRHVGHADLLREAVDGLAGEDPPDDWRP
jgi:hypothetical protein